MELWPLLTSEDTGKNNHRQPCAVTDIFTWLQCFTTYVSMCSPESSNLISELMAYMTTILRVSQDFTGLGWVRYDVAFRRLVVMSSNTKWSEINPTLYAMFFTGATRAAERCDLCMATSHRMTECWAPTLWVSRQVSHPQASSETTPSAAIFWVNKASPIGKNLLPMEQEQRYLCEVSSHPHLRNLSRNCSVVLVN